MSQFKTEEFNDVHTENVYQSHAHHNGICKHLDVQGLFDHIVCMVQGGYLGDFAIHRVSTTDKWNSPINLVGLVS